jgi:hypothetical protein
MGDFATWGEAVCRGLEKKAGEFLAAYAENRKQANESILEDSPVARLLRNFPDVWTTKWEGTASELLDALTSKVDPKVVEGKQWPKSPRGLSGMLRRLAPSLRMVNIMVEFTKEGHGKTRTITIKHLSPDKSCAQPSAPSASSASPTKDCTATASSDSTADANADGRKTQPSALRPQPSAASAEPFPQVHESQAVPNSADDADDADGQNPTLSGDAFQKLREVFEL